MSIDDIVTFEQYEKQKKEMNLRRELFCRRTGRITIYWYNGENNRLNNLYQTYSQRKANLSSTLNSDNLDYVPDHQSKLEEHKVLKNRYWDTLEGNHVRHL